MIEFRNTSKSYRSLLGRSVHAVEDFSLQITKGEILGIAGPNGAGKSTLMGLLLGYLHPTSGSVTIEGLPPRAYIEANGVGYLSELVKVNPRWWLRDTLVRYGTLAGIPADQLPHRVDAMIEQLGLGEHANKRFKALSKGNAQRLGVAQALLRGERVVILDEPTHGLDPLWTQRFRDIVDGLRHPERTIIIASHNLDELQRLADRVVIMDHGRLQRIVSMGFDPTLQGQSSASTYRLRVAAGIEHVGSIFPTATEVGKGEFDIVVHDLARFNHGIADLIARGSLIAGIAPVRSVLEEQFRAAVGE